MRNKRLRLKTLLALATLVLPVSAALAQDAGRAVRWIVPYQPGSAPDTQSRIIGEALSKVLGQAVVIDNKPGAGGNLGAQLARRAPADGNTWLYSSSPLAVNMRVHKTPGYDAMKDFIHVAQTATSDSVLVVDPRSGVNTLAELLQRLRAKPGAASYGSGGLGTPSHLAAEWLLHDAKAEAVHVPYKGAAAITLAVEAQEVLFALPVTGVALPHVQAGKLRALATTGKHRNARLPNVPTIAESGFKDISTVSFGGISVPAGTPAAAVQRIEAAVHQVLAMPTVREKILATGSDVADAGSKAYTAVVAGRIAATERMNRAAKPDAQQ